MLAILGVSAGWIAATFAITTNAIALLFATLTIMLYLLVPWTSVNLVDYFFVRRGRYAITHLFMPNGIYGSWGIRGLAAYLIGFIATVPFFVLPDVYTGPAAKALGGLDVGWVVGLAVSGGAYFLLSRSLDLSAEQAAIAESERTLRRAFESEVELPTELRLDANVLTGTNIRDAELSEIADLARMWFDGWQDAHARIVPAELVRLRTLQSFEERIRAAPAGVRVAVAGGAPVGFYFLKGAELYQFYVASGARGSGVAAALMSDAEARLGERGVDTAWLTCAIGNDRAARFYEKCGWFRTGAVTEDLEVSGGTFALEVWRYEKSLR
jgi:ribosomal protein S18 acetylase RimI-like enzyme